MTTQLYRGRIKVSGAPHQVEIEVRATSPSSAKAVAESMYNIISRSKQLSRY